MSRVRSRRDFSPSSEESSNPWTSDRRRRKMSEREVWSTRFSFIMAVLGFSIGIGNLWRFPYLVGRYGGGVFLAFYLVVVFFLTIPLFAVEITLGKATRQDPVGAYKTLAPGRPGSSTAISMSPRWSSSRIRLPHSRLHPGLHIQDGRGHVLATPLIRDRGLFRPVHGE